MCNSRSTLLLLLGSHDESLERAQAVLLAWPGGQPQANL